MQKAFIYTALLAGLMACNTPSESTQTPADTTTAPAPDNSTVTDSAGSTALLEGTWNLVPAPAKGKQPFLTFHTGESKVNGSTGCNGFGGTYRAVGDSIRFNNDFMATKMFCEGVDEAGFNKTMFAVDQFRIQGDTLWLKTNGKPVNSWVKVK
jgi:heat shock protein HslJ